MPGCRIKAENLFAIWSFDGKMVYENIIEATEEFDNKYLIGVGGQGSVYRAKLHTGQVVAVKKLHSTPNGLERSNLKAFTREIQALTEIRHRNIVEEILKDDQQAIAFDWNRRLNVIKDVANALCYMHHDCSPPIVHRDISSKNVLLNLEYVAHVSDFGTAKLLNPNSANWTSFAGTFGYAAPVALEILFGKHPGDVISSLLSSSWTVVDDIMPLMDKYLDQRLPHPTNPIVKELVSIVRMTIAC
ncbi:Tyrosine-protein kinase, active site [Sesbania bispinosa]|nr:Tyrosine-protein kinase, active site [Sesbania bispinosa]